MHSTASFWGKRQYGVREQGAYQSVAINGVSMLVALPPIPSNCYSTRASACLGILIAVPIFFFCTMRWLIAISLCR